MKKIISLIMIMALTISSFVFASAEDAAPSDLYGTVYYETDFSSLNTTDTKVPYWVITENATLNDGILTTSTTGNDAIFYFRPVAKAPAGEDIVLEMKVRFNNVSTNYVWNGLFVESNGKNVRCIKSHIYGQKLILNDNGNAVAIPASINTSAWHTIRYIYKAETGTWDVLGNGDISLIDHQHTNQGYNAIGGGLSYCTFSGNVSIDSMKVYSTKNVVQLDFDKEATNANFCDYTLTNTNGKVELAIEDGRECLMIEQVNKSELTKFDLTIPGVYARTGSPYVVVESKFKITGGNNSEIQISGNPNGQHMITCIRNYNDFLYVRDPASGGSSKYKVKEGFDYSSWYDVKYVIDMSDPAAVKYDVYVDNVLAAEDVPAVITNVNSVCKLSFIKPAGTNVAGKMFIDEINVYNATEAIVSSFDVTGTTSYSEGEIGSLSAQVKAIDGTTLEKQVTYFIKDEYENVFVATNGDVSADIGVQPGIFTVVATMEANGITYTKEVPMRVTDAVSGYKLLSSSVDTSAAEFKLADLSASGATLWSAVAVYGSDGSLKDIVINKPDFDGYVWNANVPLDGIAQEGDAVKVFFWESISGMKPYFASLEN